MASLRDLTARRRLDLSPITTSLTVQQPYPTQTPISALSSNSLSAPFGYHPAPYTPASAVRQYNPQQWTASPSVPSDHTNHFASRQETEAPAPPPYSPPRSSQPSSQRTSTISNEASESLSGGSPAARVSPSNIYRSSPDPGAQHAFPPPPPSASRARAASNDRPPGIFNLSAFTRRNHAQEVPRPSPEMNVNQRFAEHRPSPEAPVTSRFTDHRPVPIITEPLRQNDIQIHSQQVQLPLAHAPASRRAASAGAISTPSTSRSRGSSTTRWAPGMPLPPPPPVPPPPSQSRSQSVSGSERIVSPPTRRPPGLNSSLGASSLGPVPPTPAGWVDEDVGGRGRSPNRALTIDTSSVASTAPSTTTGESNSGSSNSGLARSQHVRGESRSIRERRSESKARRAVVEESSNNPWAEAITPSDISVPSTMLGRRQTVKRTTPRSSRFASGGETPNSADTPYLNTPGTGSRGSTPRPMASGKRIEAPTPPFSPGQSNLIHVQNSPSIPPKALPTPPPQSRLPLDSPARPYKIQTSELPSAGPPNSSRAGSVAPPSRSSSVGDPSLLSPTQQFALGSMERHKAFAKREAAAATDSERVRIFAEFFVAESRLRRERYAGAIDAMGSEILELTRDLFRPFTKAERDSRAVSRSSEWTPESSTGPMSTPLRSHRGSLGSALSDAPQRPAAPTPDSAEPSPAAGRPDSQWWNGYMPSLSPIPSMSVSDVLDDGDSRGRPSSRWWEVSQEGSQGTGSMRIERSKRESKYMGMPRELREALQNGDPRALENGESTPGAGPSHRKSYGPNEYPPEKTGLHDQPEFSASSQTYTQQAAMISPAAFSPALLTPNPKHLDVSRLVTLPPPYPRHHPAVNNNHPDLTSIRSNVRILSDFTEVEATKQRFLTTSAATKEENIATASKRRDSLRSSIQREIAAGTMSYTDAANMEKTAEDSQKEREKEASKADFELFQSQVVMPLNDLLMERVNKATALFEELRSKLFTDAQEQSPNLTQEEGDEQPELLEKLTLLKWIFEAREQLQKELFDLLSDRNDRYRDVVVMPYRLANNEAKLKHATEFFASDAQKRAVTFEAESLKRTEEFMDIIEENVVRGVEVQLSAFWDIAPNLSRVINKVPQDLNSFQVQIPSQEYDENVSYWDFPMQYLHSLVGHCEKSTYQFIESQINLLCLLHEVKGVVTSKNLSLMKVQRVVAGENEEEVAAELKEVEKDEESRLTDDLKEKVRCVEELWSSALGTEIKGVRERLASFLVAQGGWVEDDE